MKKLMSLAAAAAVVISLSACRAGDVGMEDRNNGVTDNRTNVGRNIGLNNNNVTNINRVNVSYRDGVYTAYGNPHDGINEKATVTIRNGRIADIDLDRTSTQANIGNAAGMGTDNQVTPRAGAINMTGNRTNNAANQMNNMGNQMNNAGGARTDVGRAIGNAAGTAEAGINEIRTNLVNAMLQNQRDDVNIVNNDRNMGSAIDNWKLAVRRALDQAR